MSNELRPIPVRTSASGARSAPAGASAIAAGPAKVLRNTYMLLSMTLLFSAAMAVLSVAVGVPYGVGLVCSLASLGLIWFVLPRVANSAKALYVVFGVTGLLGVGLGPVLSFYLKALPNGGMLIASAMGGTAAIFVGLSAYVLTTKKDFSFMGGFLMAGIIAVLVLSLGSLAASFMGFNVSGIFLGISAACMMLFSALILYETSNIIHGGETNYVMATIGLYLSIYNIFSSLLHLLGFAED